MHSVNSQVEDVGSQKSLENCHISYPNTFPSLDDGFRHPLEAFFEQIRAPVRNKMTEFLFLKCNQHARMKLSAFTNELREMGVTEFVFEI